MSRGKNGKFNEVSYDFDKCETEDDIKRGLRMYFTLEEYDVYAARAFWVLGRRPLPSELLSWLIDKGLF